MCPPPRSSRLRCLLSSLPFYRSPSASLPTLSAVSAIPQPMSSSPVLLLPSPLQSEASRQSQSRRGVASRPTSWLDSLLPRGALSKATQVRSVWAAAGALSTSPSDTQGKSGLGWRATRRPSDGFGATPVSVSSYLGLLPDFELQSG